MDNEMQAVLSRLLKSQQVAALGTLNGGQPEVSMVAYLPASDFSEIYIHISGLARHTKNIQNHDQVGLLVAEDIREGIDPQTLARISLMGRASLLDQDDAAYESIKRSYLKKYPDSEMNFQLGDFGIFRIDIENARFVAGFGKIYNLTKNGLAEASR